MESLPQGKNGSPVVGALFVRPLAHTLHTQTNAGGDGKAREKPLLRPPSGTSV